MAVKRSADELDMRVQAFIKETAPDQWEGLPVGFYQAFVGTVRAEDAFPAGQRQGLEIPRMNGGLRDGLPAADRERGVLVRAVANPRGDEEVTRGEIERAEHSEIGDSLLSQQLDEPSPRSAVLRRYRSRHQSCCESSS